MVHEDGIDCLCGGNTGYDYYSDYGKVQNRAICTDQPLQVSPNIGMIVCVMAMEATSILALIPTMINFQRIELFCNLHSYHS